jgi:AcrR family transcriptional regulator
MASERALPAPGRRDRKKRDLRARLLGEAERLFVAQGYWRTTVEQIAEAADVTTATFFNYFPSKTAALNELAAGLFESLANGLDARRAAAGPAGAALARFACDAASELRREHARLGGLLLRAVRAAAGGEGGAPLARLRGALATLLAAGQADGSVRRDLDAGVAAEMALGAWLALLVRWLDDPRYPLEARLAECAAFVGAAVAAPSAPNPRPEESPR